MAGAGGDRGLGWIRTKGDYGKLDSRLGGRERLYEGLRGYGNLDGRFGWRGRTTADKGIASIKFDCKVGGRWRGLRGTAAIRWQVWWDGIFCGRGGITGAYVNLDG